MMRTKIERQNSKVFFSTTDFDTWSERRGFNPDEKHVIEKYLDKSAKTLEAGTAGGRILFEMEKIGFSSLYGYDFVPEFIEHARHRDTENKIVFDVQDATNLSYENYYFDQLIYLQQIMSTLETKEERTKAFQEAYRVLKFGGTALFSFLSYQTSTKEKIFDMYLLYLKFIRFVMKSHHSTQYFPHTHVGGKFSLSSLLMDRRPYLYRYKLQESYDSLAKTGFKVIGIGSREQVLNDQICSSIGEMHDLPINGALFFICKK